MPANGKVENTQSRADDARAHENVKSGEQGHSVSQARADDSLAVEIKNQHGSNSIAHTGHGQDRAHSHANASDDHSVSQSRVGGNHTVLVENPNGINAVVHTEGGGVQHINTMNDGWVI
jgi:hypothetical protein